MWFRMVRASHPRSSASRWTWTGEIGSRAAAGMKSISASAVLVTASDRPWTRAASRIAR